jgi:hypothetical protein
MAASLQMDVMSGCPEDLSLILCRPGIGNNYLTRPNGFREQNLPICFCANHVFAVKWFLVILLELQDCTTSLLVTANTKVFLIGLFTRMRGSKFHNTKNINNASGRHTEDYSNSTLVFHPAWQLAQWLTHNH